LVPESAYSSDRFTGGRDAKNDRISKYGLVAVEKGKKSDEILSVSFLSPPVRAAQML
jgi:hypothetical protein